MRLCRADRARRRFKRSSAAPRINHIRNRYIEQQKENSLLIKLITSFNININMNVFSFDAKDGSLGLLKSDDEFTKYTHGVDNNTLYLKIENSNIISVAVTLNDSVTQLSLPLTQMSDGGASVSFYDVQQKKLDLPSCSLLVFTDTKEEKIVFTRPKSLAEVLSTAPSKPLPTPKK